MGLNYRLIEFDLDWRQICNGLIDCEHGEDEIDCHLLELHECDNEREFRCKSGMCIEKSFAYDHTYDCLDQSDEIDLVTISNCPTNPEISCEEFNCASMNYKYPCGDGQCRTASIGADTRDNLCYNGRNSRFYPINAVENFCQACFICHIKRLPSVTGVQSSKELCSIDQQ
jgi:hypothetical protein